MARQIKDQTEEKPNYHSRVALLGFAAGTMCIVVGAVIGPMVLETLDLQNEPVATFITYGFWVGFPTITSYGIALTSVALKWPSWRYGAQAIFGAFVLAYGLYIGWVVTNL